MTTGLFGVGGEGGKESPRTSPTPPGEGDDYQTFPRQKRKQKKGVGRDERGAGDVCHLGCRHKEPERRCHLGRLQIHLHELSCPPARREIRLSGRKADRRRRRSAVGASRRYFSSSSSLISCQLFKNIKKSLCLKSPDPIRFIPERYLIPGRTYGFIRPRKRNAEVCVRRRLHPAVGPDFLPSSSSSTRRRLALKKFACVISSHVKEAGGRKRAKSFRCRRKKGGRLVAAPPPVGKKRCRMFPNQ